MARFESAMTLVNYAAVEAGLNVTTDLFASQDPAFVQLRNLAVSAGRELLSLFQWNKFVKTNSFVTVVPPDTGNYNLPADFAYMIDQTGWSPVGGGMGLPMGGPLSEQDWAYIVNTGLGPSTIYVCFKVAQGQLQILPAPPPNGITISYAYMSRYWVAVAASTTGTKDAITANDDVILYEPILFVKFLKLRFLEAKGFDTTAAVGQFMTQVDSWMGNNVPAKVLNAARMRFYPYLSLRNVPETGYGVP